MIHTGHTPQTFGHQRRCVQSALHPKGSFYSKVLMAEPNFPYMCLAHPGQLADALARLPFGLTLLELPGKSVDTCVGDLAGGVEKLAGGRRLAVIIL